MKTRCLAWRPRCSLRSTGIPWASDMSVIPGSSISPLFTIPSRSKPVMSTPTRRSTLRLPSGSPAGDWTNTWTSATNEVDAKDTAEDIDGEAIDDDVDGEALDDLDGEEIACEELIDEEIDGEELDDDAL